MGRVFKAALIALAALAGAVALAQDRPSLVPTIAPPTAGPAITPGDATPPGASTQGSLTKQDVDTWLDGYMPYALHSGDIAGAVVTVVSGGQVLTARGYGYADVERRRPVDPARTLFRPGSVSKLVTWTAVMQLVDQGRVDLDADINTYLDFRIPPRNGQPVTMRQVMTHTAGFEESAKYIIFNDPKHIVPVGEFLKRSVPKRIYDAGSTPAYSNWATTLAAYVVQRVSGQPFDDYVEQRIFRPLGMPYATFRQPLPANVRGQMAVGYPRASAPAEPFEIVGPAAAGSLSASGVEMGRFMLAHLQNGRGILSPQAAQIMHNMPLDRVDPRSLIPPLNHMELGFFETNVNGRDVIAHLGDTSNFHTSLHLFQREGVGFYVSFNSAGKDGAVGALRGALFHDFADRYFPGERRDGRIDAKTSAEHAAMMTGNWINSRHAESNFLRFTTLIGQTAVAVNEKGELVIPALTGLGGAPRRWVEIAPFVWRDRDGEDRLAAKLVDGKVVRWSMDQISPFMVFDRAPAGLSSTWILPLLYASLAVFVLTLLYWPATWYLRRRYVSPMAAAGPSRRAYRAVRVMIAVSLAVLVGWLITVSRMLSDTNMMTDASDPLLWLLQIAGVLAFFGTVGIAAWNVVLTWRDGRRWTRKVWNVLVLLAALLLLYVAWAFGLMAMNVTY